MPTGVTPMFLGFIPLIFTAALIAALVVAVIFMIKGIKALDIYIKANRR